MPKRLMFLLLFAMCGFGLFCSAYEPIASNFGPRYSEFGVRLFTGGVVGSFIGCLISDKGD